MANDTTGIRRILRVGRLAALVLCVTLAACGEDEPGESQDAGLDLRDREIGRGGSDTGFDSSEDRGTGEDLGSGSDADEDTDSGTSADASGSVDVDASSDAAQPDTTEPDATEPDSSGSPDLFDEPDGGGVRLAGPGDIVIVEVQGNPQGTGDEVAEFIEVINVSGGDRELRGVTLAYHTWAGGGSEPTRSVATEIFADSYIVGAGRRVILGRGVGGGFTPDLRYDAFELSNGDDMALRVRLYTASWDGTEPPIVAHLIDALPIPTGQFGNANRGRSWQLDPTRVSVPSASNNDIASNWCLSDDADDLEYASTNWGTPGDPNRCD